MRWLRSFLGQPLTHGELKGGVGPRIPTGAQYEAPRERERPSSGATAEHVGLHHLRACTGGLDKSRVPDCGF